MSRWMQPLRQAKGVYRIAKCGWREKAAYTESGAIHREEKLKAK